MTIVTAAGSATSPDGVTIRYESAGQGDPCLVFVHGWSCDRSYWAAQITHFGLTHRVLALDLGGHGESSHGRTEWTMAAYGADVAAVLDALDIHDAVLIGHSMGGPVIVETARLAPDRIAALVSVDHFYDADRQPTEAQIEALIGPVRADFPGEIAALVRTFFTDRSDPALIDRISRDMASAPPEVGVSALGHVRRYDEAAGLAAVRAPMRMINADKWPTNLEAARRHKPDIQLAVMPGLGHFPFLEDPEEFNRLLARAVAETDRHHRRPDAFPAPPVASRREPRSRADSPHCG